VLSPEGGGPFCVEDEVLPFAKVGDRGAIRIYGPPGSGKSTALRHLAAALPPEHAVCVLDDPDEATVAEQAGAGLVVYASETLIGPKNIATFQLAPWGDDELIEYLLGAAPAHCGQVMSRLKAADDRGLAEGNPELWRIVLDRMIADDLVAGPRQALRQEFATLLADGPLRDRVRETCLRSLMNSTVETLAHGEPAESLALDARLQRLIRHRPIQVLIAADRIVAELAKDQIVPDAVKNVDPSFPRMLWPFPGKRWPRDIVREAGFLVRESQKASARLVMILERSLPDYHPMAASLLHATGIGWRPAPGSVPRLSKAYLDGVDWLGIALPSAEMDGVEMDGARLLKARLDSARLEGARLSRARLNEASLGDAFALDADLSHSDLSSIRADGASFQKANLEGACLQSASLRRAWFLEANLTDARFLEANLTDAILERANIEGADFRGAILESAKLKGLKLSRARFEGASFACADLSVCDLEGMDLPEARFRRACLRGGYLTGSIMPGADFRGANLQGAGLAEVEWEGACLAGADLQGASFHMGSSRSGLVGSPIASEGSRTGFYTDDLDEQGFKSPEEIRKANLRGADLRGANIEGVDFYLVDLRGATFDPGQAEQLRHTGAILADRA
jgi:uncharacterized protein YjbI with pentapeptide repeats/energy-coupling factor transporter ATP-binding protein EcfA2